jgi:hypothetical protein
MYYSDFVTGGTQPFDQQLLPEPGVFRNEDFYGGQWRFPVRWF